MDQKWDKMKAVVNPQEVQVEAQEAVIDPQEAAQEAQEEKPQEPIDTHKLKIRLAAIKKSLQELEVEQNQRAMRLEVMYEQVNDAMWKVVKGDDLLGETSWSFNSERSLSATKSIELMPELKEITKMREDDEEYELRLPLPYTANLYVAENAAYLNFRNQEDALKFVGEMNLVLSPVGMEKMKQDCVDKIKFYQSIIETGEDEFAQEFLAHEKEEIEVLAKQKIEERAKQEAAKASKQKEILAQVKEKQPSPEFAEGMNRFKDILGELASLEEGEPSETRKAFREQLLKEFDAKQQQEDDAEQQEVEVGEEVEDEFGEEVEDEVGEEPNEGV